VHTFPLNRLWLLGLGVMLATTLGACTKHEGPAKTASGEVIIKIGSVSPLTGPQAHIGKDNENGAQLAFDEINAKGLTLGGQKVHFELVSMDDQADPKTATIVAQKLVDMGVKGVIGHLNSGTSIPASKIYSDAGIPEISPSATAIKYTEQGFKTTFRTMTNDRQQGKVVGEFAVKQMAGKRVAIVDDRTAYGQGLADQVAAAVKAVGGEVVTREYTTDKETDFAAILTSIQAKKPDVLFFGGMDPQAAPMVRQMHTLGMKAKFLGADGVETLQFIKLAGPDAEGVTASSPGLPLETMPGGKEFEAKYTAKYGPIQVYAPYAYDAAYALVDAMKLADSPEPAKYLPMLSKVHFQGVTGEVAFDRNGDLQGGAITLYRVKNGAWSVVETVKSGAKQN
jgi:branched-chain amino acid transport system substrate-binding protein